MRNGDEVIDRDCSDVSNPRENSAWRAMELKTKADIRRRRKPLIDSSCNWSRRRDLCDWNRNSRQA